MSPAVTDLALHSTRSFEPPYDDEPGATIAVTDGALALALPLPLATEAFTPLRLLPGGRESAPVPPPRRPRKQVAKKAHQSRPEQPASPAAPVPAEPALPPAKAFGARLVQVLSEATTGQRPLAHLAPHLSGHVYERLERHFAATVRGTGRSGADNRIGVRSIRVCEPGPGVAEVAAVVRRGERMAAIALRLEGVNGRWQCTALQIG